jgi:CO/xanthine dehydrogenase FAD-binding subunit
MLVGSPRSLDAALEEMAADPGARPLAGGTDLMVALNFGRERPAHLVSLRHVDELRELSDGERVRIGAGVPYTELMRALPDAAMVQAARTIGSPQIRNAGTIGGNLGTCSPAGDTLPVLAALDAEIVIRSASDGERRTGLKAFMKAPKKPDLRPGEVVVAVEWDAAGPAQAFLKAGTRNAMVIAVANLAMVVDRRRRRIGLALGSVGPTIVRAHEAEAFAAGLFEESGWDRVLRPSDPAAARFGELCAAAAAPIDDVRGSAAYRRHIVSVMARRALTRTGAVL